MEIPHLFFLNTPGISTSFLTDPWNFHMFFPQDPWKFHVFNPPCLDFFWNSPMIMGLLASAVSSIHCQTVRKNAFLGMLRAIKHININDTMLLYLIISVARAFCFILNISLISGDQSNFNQTSRVPIKKQFYKLSKKKFFLLLFCCLWGVFVQLQSPFLFV